MPRFSRHSINELRLVESDLKMLMNRIIEHMDIRILEGHRSRQDQNRAYMTGKSKLPYPHSMHNTIPSRAVDAAPWPIEWENRPRWDYFGGFVMGYAAALRDEGLMTQRIRWGGDWDRDHNSEGTRFYDAPHFELLEEDERYA